MTEPNKTKRPEEMTEAELAEYFYAHRDDLAGEEVPSRAPERMDVMISARFTPSEAAELRAAAEQARMSVSAFLRQRVMATLHTNVVDLERARADLKDVYTKAADALRALAENTPPTSRHTGKSPADLPPKRARLRLRSAGIGERDTEAHEANPVRITSVDPPAAHLTALPSDDAVVVLPVRESEDGVGIYPEGTVTLVKTLRMHGLNARYAHPPELRAFEGKKGVLGDAVLTIVLGVISSGAWDTIKSTIRKRRRTGAPLRVTFGQVTAETSEVTWWNVEGDADSAIAAVDRILGASTDEDRRSRPRSDNDVDSDED